MQLGRYQILKQLATGSVADVWLARATGLEGFARHVVLKRIRPELALEQRLVESFLEEARIAGSLHHHNIVQVHDIGEHEGSYFFAMEYIHGEDVRKLLAKVRERKEQVPLEHVIAIITATAAGLHHAHEQRNVSGEHLGLVHRDVCPANILLGYDGSVKLVDFGMAKAALRSTKTASGSLKGKASYMSPEQCCGLVVDRRTDTFSLGIVLYELATARRLYKGANEFLTMAAIVEGDVPPPSALRDDLPRGFDELALRALARAPESRFQTAEDLRAELERFAIEHELRASNKALADYVSGLFGQRLEPWHVESTQDDLLRDFENTHGGGLVVAPASTELLTRHAVRSTSPIVIAQTMTEEHELWSDDEHVTTSAHRPSRQHEAAREQLRTAKPASLQMTPSAAAQHGDDDPFSATIVAPPVFPDIEPPGPLDEEEPAPLVLVEDIRATPTHGAPAAALPGSGADALAPARPVSEQVYVGPPAPSQLHAARAFVAAHRPQVLIGVGAGLLAVGLTALAVRGCGDSTKAQTAAPVQDAPATPPDPAAAARDDQQPKLDPDVDTKSSKKKAAVKRPTGSGSAR